MELASYLADCEARYNAERRMLGQPWQGPGYHTRIANGTWAHPTRESLDYALAQLRSGAPQHTARAAEVVAAVLALQDRDPTSKTYGIWPWLAEEPLAEMAPPDWNWADFCGARVAHMLCDFAALLPGALVAAMRASLGHAAWSIFRRNVQPSYTNIAIMGAGVALATGELLGETRLLDYGRARLQRFVEHTAYHGGLNEYNSPTYTLVAIQECERILHLTRDEQARELAERIRRSAWETVAEHFHPPTSQWAGPHSRTYGDWLSAEAAEYLSAQTGAAIVAHPHAATHGRGGPQLIPPLPCPPELAARFHELPASQYELRRRFIRNSDEALSLYGTTWMDDGACLGSASWDSLWTQRRPLVAYWRADPGPAAMMRLRFLHDGQDFATAGVRVSQRGARALAGVGLLSNRGDFHLHLDRPADGLFPAGDLRVRLELRADGAVARQLDEQLFELAAGQWRARIHLLPSSFAGQPLRWETGASEDGATLDGVCAPGLQTLDPQQHDAAIMLGIELLRAGQAPAAAPRATVRNDRVKADWGAELQLGIPMRAEPYPS
jgi:hypothetical protein